MKLLATITVITIALSISACSTVHDFKDLSEVYCASVDINARQVLEADLNMTVDYCALRGLVDAMKQ